MEINENLNKLFGLQDKVAIVTGASRGLGKGMAIGLAEAGAKVIAVSTDKNNLQSTIKEITEFALEQNYPNPFNPSTKIKYSIAKQGFVTIKIFDVLGREIVTLVNKEQPVGNYEVEFNASSVNRRIRKDNPFVIWRRLWK